MHGQKLGYTISIRSKKHFNVFIVELFCDQQENKYSDDTLAFMINDEFPFRSSEEKYLRYIPMYRNKYNRGEFSTQSEPPRDQIPKYEGGEAISGSRGPKPRLPGEKIERRK